MRFHFPLDGVLHVRLLLEEQARERLETCLLKLRAVEHRMSEGRRWRERSARVRARMKKLPAIELQFVEHVLGQADVALSRLEAARVELARQASELRAVYLGAHRERETLSTLREAALVRHRADELRREQRALDEFHLGKMLRARGEARLATDLNETPDESRKGLP
jgi:flagellar export protein FliJ